jgi:hypothetical protein
MRHGHVQAVARSLLFSGGLIAVPMKKEAERNKMPQIRVS